MKIIYLTNKNLFTVVDDEDFEKVANHEWHWTHGYARTAINGKKIYLHRFVMDAQPEQIIDHINHNTLDNQKSNLRFCTSSQNNHNRKHGELPLPQGKRLPIQLTAQV